MPHGRVVSIDPVLYTNSHLAHIRLNKEIPVLDLRPPNIRNLSEARERWDEWQQLAVVSERDYPRTHAAAAELLATAPAAAGILWHSRQFGRDTTMVLYKEPLVPADFQVLREIALDSPEGSALIDKALQMAELKRAAVGALAASINGSGDGLRRMTQHYIAGRRRTRGMGQS